MGRDLLKQMDRCERHGSPRDLVQVWTMQPGFPITDVMDAPRLCGMTTHHIRDRIAAVQKLRAARGNARGKTVTGIDNVLLEHKASARQSVTADWGRLAV